MYNHQTIEAKWRNKWEDMPKNKASRPKYYCLDMFPYPSASGLHVGHWRGYVLSDVISRYKTLQGFDVLHPMGFDAFGLPTENYAIKEGIHPIEITKTAVENYKRQLSDIGALYDWDNEVNTTDPEFYKWTQWIFIKMFEAGLAYEKEMPLNWCPNCKIVKANEEVKDGECDRCGTTTTKKNLRQWMLKITTYAERLLNDLDTLDWPEKVIKMQREWIGKSSGASIHFKTEADQAIEVFTTRPDTIYGATFLILAPEHPLVQTLTTAEQQTEIEGYIQTVSAKSNIDRMADKEKTGVFTGCYAINPLSGEKMPIWIADYVLADYGTGAIMAVPGHDERDFEFATKFGITITQVIEGKEEVEGAYLGDGPMINSGPYNGKPNREALELIIDQLEAEKQGKRQINYKLRDWVFSRQRYWGEPIPLIHCPSCGTVAVPEKDLPVRLPHTERYQPTDTGESPLADIPEFVNCQCPKCEQAAKRETNTMPQWAGSSWYFLRYPDPKNPNQMIAPEIAKENLPVDLYVGGVEHAVLHLLYARFYTKFLHDIGEVSFAEPFKRLFNQGMVLKTGVKMSKSIGNVVSPDDIIKSYGTDALRMYELFIAPPELDAEWEDTGIEGVSRYLNRLYKLVEEYKDKLKDDPEIEKVNHQMVRDITWRLENFSLNTVVSGFMEYTNKITALGKTHGGLSKEVLTNLVLLVAPIAPFIASELWETLGKTTPLFENQWPTFDEEKAKETAVEIGVQVNGKLRTTLAIELNEAKEVILEKAKAQLDLAGKEIVKEIYVPGKIVNLVVK